MGLSLLFWWGGAAGWGWLEKVKIKLNSTQVVVGVEVRVKRGNETLCKFIVFQSFSLAHLLLVLGTQQ